MAVAPSLPSSPWAERYPMPSLITTHGLTTHSLLAPRNPNLTDPKYHEQDPNPDDAHHRAESNRDIDLLLWGEAAQKKTLQGLRTYQLAVVNRRLMFSTSNGPQPVAEPDPRISRLNRLISRLHLPASPKSRQERKLRKLRTRKSNRSLADPKAQEFQTYEREKIKVNERTWLPFLRKDRWFDWTNLAGRFPLQPRPSGTWSVDDEELWKALSVCLELVNRILNALLDDKHVSGCLISAYAYSIQLRTMLYGRWDFWRDFEDLLGEEPYDNATVLLSHSQEQALCEKRGTDVCEYEQTVNSTVEEARDRLIKLLSNMIWGFVFHSDCHGCNTHKPSAGSGVEPYSSLITLHAGKVEALLNPDLTVRELCKLQVHLAITIVHELMHALLFARYSNDDYVGNRITVEGADYDGLDEPEPFLDGKGYAESGFYNEALIFGGKAELAPSAVQIPSMPPMTLYIEQWPNAGSSKDSTPGEDPCPFLQDGAWHRVYHTPSTWSSKLLSEAFWNDAAFPRKSDNFFHNPRLFVATAPVIGKSLGPIAPVRAFRLNQSHNNYVEAEDVLKDWASRELLWNNIRSPWYEEAFALWNGSPWCDMFERRRMQLFEESFNKKDHAQCAVYATRFANNIGWHKNRAKYLDYLPEPDTLIRNWAWHTIGLLMLASLPLRHQVITKDSPHTKWTVELAPSKSAAAAGHHMTIYTPTADDPPNPVIGNVSVFYDQTKPDGGKVDDFTQLDYLELITKTVKLIAERGGPLHIKFLDAIIATRDALLEDRRQLERSYPGGHSTRWASKWPFKWPEYDPAISTWENGEWTEYVRSNSPAGNSA